MKLTALLLHLLFSLNLYAVDPPAPLSGPACANQNMAPLTRRTYGPAPAEPKVGSSTTEVVASPDGKTISVYATSSDAEGRYERDVVYTRRDDGRWDVADTVRETFKDGRPPSREVSSYIADRPPTTMVSIQDANQAEYHNREYKKKLRTEYQNRFELTEEETVRGEGRAAKFDVEHSRAWSEAELFGNGLTGAMLNLPPDRLARYMIAGIHAIGMERERFVALFEGRAEYSDTVFDKDQSNLIDVLRALNNPKDIGSGRDIAKLKAEVLAELKKQQAYPGF